MDAELSIYTFKEGLLSKLAHDLRLSLTRFEISVQGAEVQARFETGSLHIDGALKAGMVARDELSESDRQKIQNTLFREVLRVGEQPEARFVGRTLNVTPPFTLSGELTLCGVTRPLSIVLALRSEQLAGELELIPSEWGIRPYRALAGALRVQDRVRVVVSADAAFLTSGAQLDPTVRLVWAPNRAP